MAQLPSGKANIPKEKARQPQFSKRSKNVSFAGKSNIDEELQSSQRSSVFKDVLSQPSGELSHRQRMLWLQKRRYSGLWVQCNDCDRWRYLDNILDSHELPTKWYCNMNPESAMANCSVAETTLRVCDEEDLIYSEYSAGSVVWARLDGWPWWPAMVDDCVDTEQYYWLDGFSDIPTNYNVVFFDTHDVTRAWISPINIKPYASNKDKMQKLIVKNKFASRIKSSMLQAEDAIKLSVLERLEKYSFIARYKGPICTPKKINKRVLNKYKQKLEKKFNVNFINESSDDSEEEIESISQTKRTKVIRDTDIKLNKAKETMKEKDPEQNMETKIYTVL